jgi:uncharacterized protein
MSSRLLSRTTRRSHLVRRLAATTAASALLALGVLAACSDAEPAAPAKPRTVYGPAQNLGSGTARVFVTLGNANRPVSVGVALSESALTNLPMTPMPGMPSAAMLMLALPAEASATGFDHVMLDWNPQGHEPEHVYTLPHFDFHFYTVTQAEQMAILPSDPQFAAKAAKLPAADLRPAGYADAATLAGAPAAAATVPAMGLHWLATDAHELHGQTFTQTFIYGSYDGHFIFIEPMITKAFIESVKTMPNASIMTPVGLPAKYERPGYAPTQYGIVWDAAAKEYRIVLDGLTQH